MAIAQMFQYACVMLLVANFSGNRFFNGILFGCANAVSMIISGLLLQYMPDMSAFRIVFSLGMIGYALLIFFTDNPTVSYLAIVLLVTSIGGWNNIM